MKNKATFIGNEHRSIKSKTLPEQSKSKSLPTSYRIFVDGAGQGPFGTGSGYAWIQENSGTRLVKKLDGLTNNQAEYHALLSTLKCLPPNSTSDIFSDSQLMVQQFNGVWAVRDPDLQKLLDQVREVIETRRLQVKLLWVPREQNLAGRLL